MSPDSLDVRLLRFRSRRDESPHQLAHDLLEAARSSEALEVVQAALVDGEDDPTLLVLEGRCWFEEGDLPQAQAALMRAVKVQPRHTDAYRWLSQVLMKRGEPQRAVKVLERAMQIEPGNAELERALQRSTRLAAIAVKADSGGMSEPPAKPAAPQAAPVPKKQAKARPLPPPSLPAPAVSASAAPPAVVPSEPAGPIAGVEQQGTDPSAAPPAFVDGGPDTDRHSVPAMGVGMARQDATDAHRSIAELGEGLPSFANDTEGEATPNAEGIEAAGALASEDGLDLGQVPGEVTRPGAERPVDEEVESEEEPTAAWSTSAEELEALRAAATPEHARASQQTDAAATARPVASASRSARPMQSRSEASASRSARPLDLGAASRSARPQQVLPSPTSAEQSALPRPAAANSSAPPFGNALQSQPPTVAEPTPAAAAILDEADALLPDPDEDASASSGPVELHQAPSWLTSDELDSDSDPASASWQPDAGASWRSDASASASMRSDASASASMGDDAAASASMRDDAAASAPMRDDASASASMRDDAAASWQSDASASESWQSDASASESWQSDASASESWQSDASASASMPHEAVEPVGEPAPGPSAPEYQAAPAAAAEPPEQVLQLLKDQGVFEEPEGAQPEQDWVARKDAPRSGTRIGGALLAAWVVALGLGVGGYYGWDWYKGQRHNEADDLITQARQAATVGDHASLVEAERQLVQARALHPRGTDVTEALLFVHASRALEDGTGELGYLRPSVARAEKANVAQGLSSAARALLGVADRNLPAARDHAKKALAEGEDDARVLYVLGRLYQRLGSDDAAALLSKATEKNAKLVPAWIARAELARAAGQKDDALSMLDKARVADDKGLRISLWRALISGGEQGPDQLLAQLNTDSERLKAGAPTDRMLAALVRARALEGKGDHEAALKALAEASDIKAYDPEMQILLSEVASQLGDQDRAFRSATMAMNAVPANRRYRDMLASILLKRGDGQAVLSALRGLEGNDAWVVATRAKAALLTSSPDVMGRALTELNAYLAQPEHSKDPDAAALALRLRLRSGEPAKPILRSARVLARKAPERALPAIAVGEAAIKYRDHKTAIRSLEKARKMTPDDAETHYLLGRAYRMGGDTEAARQSLSRALVLSPGHVQARQALGGLLLDAGQWGEAERLFGELAKAGGGLANLLGQAEAQIGARRLSEARTLLDGLSEAQQALSGTRVLWAKLHLARDKPRLAAAMLKPLAEDDSANADLLALYGDVLYYQDRVDPAAGVYERALDVDSGHPDALIGRAAAAVRAEKTKQAYKLLSKAERSLRGRLRPPAVRAKMLLTWAKADVLKRRFTQARARLAEATGLQGVEPEAYFWYGEALSATKAPGGMEAYERYLSLVPQGELADRARRALKPR